jgi:hypothetical protein
MKYPTRIERHRWGLLSHYYQPKEFEYRVTGAKTYPAKETLFAFLDAIIPKIEPVAYQALRSK